MYDFDAGVLCLDFANTVEWHASDHPHDWLKDFADLVQWGEKAGRLPAGRADHLRQLAKEQPGKARAVFDRAIQLREAIFRLFVNFAREAQVDAGDLAILNDTLQTARTHQHVVHSSSGLSWAWKDSPDELAQILWPVAHSAGELLTSDQLDRVAQCADDRGCGYLFLDTSRNRSRRWCSMESCGNRAKARRHYQRHKEEN
jgi:predicted RNA-binding Zn ribbon-like protein